MEPLAFRACAWSSCERIALVVWETPGAYDQAYARWIWFAMQVHLGIRHSRQRRKTSSNCTPVVPRLAESVQGRFSGGAETVTEVWPRTGRMRPSLTSATTLTKAGRIDRPLGAAGWPVGAYSLLDGWRFLALPRWP